MKNYKQELIAIVTETNDIGVNTKRSILRQIESKDKFTLKMFNNAVKNLECSFYRYMYDKQTK